MAEKDNITMGANILVIVGGIAWGLKALNVEIVPMIVTSAFAPMVYGLVGISAVVLIAKDMKWI